MIEMIFQAYGLSVISSFVYMQVQNWRGVISITATKSIPSTIFFMGVSLVWPIALINGFIETKTVIKDE